MEFEDILREVLVEIAKSEEGKKELIDYAQGKIDIAREILKEYAKRYYRKTGNQIDFANRYLEDNATILINKTLLELYEQWKVKGGREITSVQDTTIGVLKHFEDIGEIDSRKPEEIRERIQTEIDETNVNSYIARKLENIIKSVIENARHSVLIVLGTERNYEKTIEDFEDEIRSLLQNISEKDIYSILQCEEKGILNRVSNKLQEILEERRKENESKGKKNQFLKSIKVEGIDYSKIMGINEQEGQQGEKKGQVVQEHVEDLPGDILL